MNSEALAPSSLSAALPRAPVAALPTASRAVSNAMVLLLFAYFFFANSSLKVVQYGIELMLGAALIAFLYRCTLKWHELLLIVVYLLSVAVSCMYNTLTVGVLCAKAFGLAILSLLVFSKVRMDATVTVWIVVANILMTVYQFVFGSPTWFRIIVGAIGGSWKEWIDSRPLGLFMNAHNSATLTAVFFLWIGRRKLVAGFGLLVLLVSSSTYTILSYVSQQMQRFLVWLRVDALVMPLAGLVAIVLFVNAEAVLNFELISLGYFTSREQGSFETIAGQLLSREAYTKAVTLLPGDPASLHDFVDDWANEVGYFTLIHQGGLIMGLFFFGALLYRIKGFRVFMAVSMLHYGLAMTPLMIFLLIQWSRDMEEGGLPGLGPLRPGARSE